MYILILASSLRSTYCSIIISLKIASHLCIHLFLETPQFLFSLGDTSSVSSNLCQDWLRLLLGLRLFLLLLSRNCPSHIYLIHWWTNNRLFNLSLLLIIFLLFSLPGHHLLAFNTSLSQTGSLRKVTILSLFSFGFLSSVSSSIVYDNDPILRHVFVSAFSRFSTSASLLFLVMLIQMFSKGLQVVELFIAVVTLKDSDASIKLWGIERSVLGLLPTIDS